MPRKSGKPVSIGFRSNHHSRIRLIRLGYFLEEKRLNSLARSLRFAGVTLSGCLALAGCVNGFGLSGPSLEESLTDHTVVFDAPEGLPAERETYHADGTLTRMFRPWLFPETLSKGSGYWWIEDGRYCTSGNIREEADGGSCHTVKISGDRIRFTPWSPPQLIEVFPELRRVRTGRLID